MNVPTIAKNNILSSYAVLLDSHSGIGRTTVADTDFIHISYARDCLIIRSEQPLEAVELAIYNTTGQLLSLQTLSLSDGYAEHPLDSLPSGCYIARLTDGSHTAICKFIIK